MEGLHPRNRYSEDSQHSTILTQRAVRCLPLAIDRGQSHEALIAKLILMCFVKANRFPNIEQPFDDLKYSTSGMTPVLKLILQYRKKVDVEAGFLLSMQPREEAWAKRAKKAMWLILPVCQYPIISRELMVPKRAS
jgi:hypothetical protein